MRDPQPIAEQVADLDLVEQLLDRIATPDEAAAARRILGVTEVSVRLSGAFAPELPPAPTVGAHIDHLAHAQSVVARYQERVDSYPDDDPTPLHERERVLQLALLDLRRLEDQ